MRERIHDVIRARRIEVVGDDDQGRIILRPTRDGASLAVNGPLDDEGDMSYVELVASSDSDHQTKTGVHVITRTGDASDLDSDGVSVVTDRDSVEERLERVERLLDRMVGLAQLGAGALDRELTRVTDAATE